MNGQPQSRARLLAQASTIALLAAAGSFGTVTQAEAACLSINAPTTISTDQECATVTNTVNGNVVNNANVGPPLTAGDPGFFVGKLITGELLNNDTISGGGINDSGDLMGALTIGGGADIAGGIRNAVQINSASGNGINLGYGTTGSFSSAAMTGAITNSAGIHGGVDGVAALFGTMSGGLTNGSLGNITGGNIAINIADTFTSWSGGISNSGNIAGDAAGIAIGGTTSSPASGVIFSGGIFNNGGATISSLNGPSVLAGGQEFNDGIQNYGLITQRDPGAAGGEGVYAGVGILVTAETFNGGIYNAGQIEGLGGPAVWITQETATFNGPIQNDGFITSSLQPDGIGVSVESFTFAGNFTNNNLISGAQTGAQIVVTDFLGNVTNTGLIEGNSGAGFIVFASSTIDGASAGLASEITNRGTIRGALNGLVVNGGQIHANVTNEAFDLPNALPALIEATNGVGLFIGADAWSGNVTNGGTILSQASGPGNGTGVLVSTGSYSGDVTNSGVIEGATRGLSVVGEVTDGCEFGCSPGSFEGTISNTGLISGGSTGVSIVVGQLNGALTNNGTITGGNTGLVIGPTTDSFFFGKSGLDGSISNDGTITGGSVGATISLGTINGNITNGGLISGDVDGLRIFADTISGNVTNNGTIYGGSSATGLFISAGSMTGNITNNLLLSAVSNALHLQIGNLTGQVTNTGTIEAIGGGQAVLLAIGNGTVFENTGGGLILGDVAFNNPVAGPAVYQFTAGDGGIVGDLNGGLDGGELADDTIVVNGEHFFVDGTANNFSSFTVANGGVALMGTRSFGGSSDNPYAFAGVADVNVNNGGMLYIDQATTLVAENSYTQQSGGALVFDLGAPGGSGFSALTGSQVALSGDYGQLIVNGPVTLSGTIGAVLDSAFASANPALTEVIYNDVIISQGATADIIGDFTTTALISNNSLFELFDLIDENTVDLRVVRSSLGQNASISDLIVGVSDPFDGNIADRTNGIGSGGCGLAGPGYCFNRFAANEVGATQVMTDASPGEDPFAWLRTGVRRVGETAVWGRGVGVWGNTDGQANLNIPGADFSLGGGIVGVDHVFTTDLLAGVAAQWTSTDVDFDGRQDNADVSSFEFGVYGSYGDTRLYVNANVSYIWHDFDVTRFVGATFANGDYDGSTISAYVEGGKIFETQAGMRIQPIIALSYAHLETDGYLETGSAATLLQVFDADFDTLKGMFGARFAYPFDLSSGRKWVPEARIVWSHEFMDDHSSHFVTPQVGPVNPTLVSGETFARDSLILGGGVTAPLADDATAFVDYDAGLNSDVTTHTVSAGVRVRW
jgi:uncharacterized protein YhjY with autotransporter beta-barrel domain